MRKLLNTGGYLYFMMLWDGDKFSLSLEVSIDAITDVINHYEEQGVRMII